MLAKVGEPVLPAIEGSGPIEAWIIDVASTVSGLGRRAAIACAQPTASIPSRWWQTCWIRTLSPAQPNQVWLADITYIPTSAGSTWP